MLKEGWTVSHSEVVLGELITGKRTPTQTAALVWGKIGESCLYELWGGGGGGGVDRFTSDYPSVYHLTVWFSPTPLQPSASSQTVASLSAFVQITSVCTGFSTVPVRQSGSG